jgi:diadenylate cyclase
MGNTGLGFEFYWLDLLDIALLSILFYYLFLIIRGTKGVQLLRGMVIIFLATFLSRMLGLRTLNFILEKMLPFGALAILIIFAPEFRNALVKLGEGYPFEKTGGLSKEKVDEIVRAAFKLAKEHRGALIVLEGKVGLADYVPSGKTINGEISRELLLSIFNPASPLHDGAVIISQNKILAASCILPLSENPNLKPQFGTRHRAGLGLSEETDSLVLIVSEERGSVSLARKGVLSYNISAEEATGMLNEVLGSIPGKKDENKQAVS